MAPSKWLLANDKSPPDDHQATSRPLLSDLHIPKQPPHDTKQICHQAISWRLLHNLPTHQTTTFPHQGPPGYTKQAPFVTKWLSANTNRPPTKSAEQAEPYADCIQAGSPTAHTPPHHQHRYSIVPRHTAQNAPKIMSTSEPTIPPACLRSTSPLPCLVHCLLPRRSSFARDNRPPTTPKSSPHSTYTSPASPASPAASEKANLPTERTTSRTQHAYHAPIARCPFASAT